MSPPQPTTPSKKRASAATVTPSLVAKKIKQQQQQSTYGSEDEPRTEVSPNSLSKCQRCGNKIEKGQVRYGENIDKGYRWWHITCKDVYHHRPRKDPSGKATCPKCKTKIPKGTIRIEKEIWVPFRYSYTYYHPTCLTDNELKELELPPQAEIIAAATAAATSSTNSNNDDNNSNNAPPNKDQHEPLRQNLKRLRSAFAVRLSCQPFKIYSNDLIEDLISKMPKNKDELLSMKGIGPKKFQSFGSTILLVLKQHRQRIKKKQQQEQEKSTNSKIPIWFRPKKQQQQQQAPKKKKKKHTGTAADDNEVPDLEVIESLTCEEIVNRKFEHAKQNGYIIEI